MTRALRASSNGGSLSLNKEMKKEMKEKGVTERIRHFKAPRTRISIRIIVSESKMKPPSPYSETPKTVTLSDHRREGDEK